MSTLTRKEIEVALLTLGSSLFLRGYSLQGLDLSRLDFGGVDMSELDLRSVNFTNSKLVLVDLSGANLRGAKLSMADLSGANLSGSDLRESISILDPDSSSPRVFFDNLPYGVNFFILK